MCTQPMDVDVFLKGGGALDINSVRKKPKDWIPDNVWLSIIALSFMVRGAVCAARIHCQFGVFGGLGWCKLGLSSQT